MYKVNTRLRVTTTDISVECRINRVLVEKEALPLYINIRLP